MSKLFKTMLILITIILIFMVSACGSVDESSAVTKMNVDITTNAAGNTVEQENIGSRLLQDNMPGSIKHLYVISAYSGQTIIYSTVKGKVTSGGKRLTPKTVIGGPDGSLSTDNNTIRVGNKKFSTNEVMQDDGTYGDSMNYLYWFDTKGIYHQHYVTGGQIVHISSEPVAVKSVIINMETTVN